MAMLLSFVKRNVEWLFWILALLLLFFLPENTHETSLCFFSLLGWGSCPGCGIGHAIHYALRLDLLNSFHHHPLGIFGLMIILGRIKQLSKNLNNRYETKPD